MKLLILFGPAAVGKMTVGQEIARQTGLRLFHNHMSIELVYPFFEFGTPSFERLVEVIRTEIMREVARSELPGMIFTFTWALDDPEDGEYLRQLIQPFVERKAEIFYVELASDQAVRLQRNRDPHRLAHKASKRELERAEKVLLQQDERHRFHSLAGEFAGKAHFRIDSTKLTAEETAKRIIERFAL